MPRRTALALLVVAIVAAGAILRAGPAAKPAKPGSMSVVHNGVTIHENVRLKGTTRAGARGFVQRGPLKLQDHGHRVRYRNIWLVELKR